MQLANQSGDPDQKMSPSIYTALVDSLFQDAGPMFVGALCAAVAAVMTAVKTGNVWLWPCVLFLIGIPALICELHFGCTRPLRRVLLLVADEAFLSEHRYRGVVFTAGSKKMMYISGLGRI